MVAFQGEIAAKMKSFPHSCLEKWRPITAGSYFDQKRQCASFAANRILSTSHIHLLTKQLAHLINK
jgi:hypothetical protein